MITAARHRRPVRFLVVLSGGLGLVLALAAAASASSSRGVSAGAGAAAAGRAAASGGTWGTAEELPGIAALNQGGNARISSVSCARAGDCGAGGDYTDASGRFQVFVVSES